MGGATNSSFLALIPKELGATSLDRFRPISLCNISYKIMAKIIANRLTPFLRSLILPNQGGFVAGRTNLGQLHPGARSNSLKQLFEGNQVWKLNWIWKMHLIE
jgi:hypothetical protein